jgi:hypothetical protein
MRQSRRGGVLVLGVIVALAAVNLRPALASVGPVLPDIRADLRLSGTVAALVAGGGPCRAPDGLRSGTAGMIASPAADAATPAGRPP